MNVEYINLISFPIFMFFILISILGFGNLFNKIIYINTDSLGLKNLFFIQGLIFIGLIFIFINIFFPINNIFSFLVIFLGSIFYLYNFIKIDSKKNEIIFILFIIIFSFIFSFYSGLSDDFNYHYETIKNFKNKNLFEITHHRTISYNSHWLFLTSIFSISYFTSSLFILTSLFYSITIYDLFKVSLIIKNNKEYYLSIISYLILIFFLGVLNQYKDLGTDIPGVIICIYIFLLIFQYFFKKNVEGLINIYIFLFLLGYFALIIKITNSLIFLFLIFIILKLKKFKINYWSVFIVSLLPLPWMFQNYIISGCLIWPISLTCFSNIDLAVNETYLIESFAKGDISTTMNVNDFYWIKVWFANHFNKLIEIYLVYILVLLIPIIFIFRKKENRKEISLYFSKENFFGLNYLYILLIILISNLVWFVYAPAYRFGIFYNLSLIIILFIPFLVILIEKKYNFIVKYSKYLFVFIFIYFLIENFNKIEWYDKRYDVWPPIKNGELLKRNNH